MQLRQFNSELNEAIHKFYRDQKFFKAIKNYPNETKKIIIEYFRKKGVKITTSGAGYSNEPIDYQKESSPLSAADKKTLKNWGLTTAEIKQLPKISADDVVNAIKNINIAPYNVRRAGQRNEQAYKDWLDNLDKDEREKTFKSILTQSKKNKREKHADLVDRFSVDSDFFAASVREYRNDFEFPGMEYNEKEFIITLKTNESFFEDGHDLHIKVFGDGGDKYRASETYKYKINLMDKITDVLDDLWEFVEKSLKRHEKGEESDKDKDKEKEQEREYKENPQVSMIKGYFSKWYGRTKTGKLRELDIRRMPAEVSVLERGAGTKYLSTHKQTRPQIVVNLTIKGGKPGSASFEKKYPDIMEKYRAFNAAYKQVTGSWRAPDLESMFGNKVFSEEHDKFYKRLEFITRKLVSDGYIPNSSRNSYKESEPDLITFAYSRKIHEAYKEDPEGTIQRVMNSNKFKNNVYDHWHKKGTKPEDMPREFVKRILEARTRS